MLVVEQLPVDCRRLHIVLHFGCRHDLTQGFAVNGRCFEVNIVPHTLQETIIDGYLPGWRVNLEVDLLARYLERLLLGTLWDQLGQASQFHFFDFEAVVIYVLRWDLIDRWTHYEAGGARDRILELADVSLGDYRRMFAMEMEAA